MLKIKLIEKMPELEQQYHPTKNVLPFDEIRPTESAIRTWICPDCREDYELSTRKRVYSGSGCPCGKKNATKSRKMSPPRSKTLAQLVPGILMYWDRDKNEKIGLIPEHMSDKYPYHVHLICPYGHAMEQTIASFKHKGIYCRSCDHKIIKQNENKIKKYSANSTIGFFKSHLEGKGRFPSGYFEERGLEKLIELVRYMVLEIHQWTTKEQFIQSVHADCLLKKDMRLDYVLRKLRMTPVQLILAAFPEWDLVPLDVKKRKSK